MPAGSPTPDLRSASLAVRRALGVVAGTLALAALAATPAHAAPASFAGVSADGSRVFFTTTDRLVPGDTDKGFQDVYERSYDGEPGIGTYVTRELSTGSTGGNDAYPAFYQGASANGDEVFFSTQEPLVSVDHDHAVDLYVHDTATGATNLVSQAASSCATGSCGDGPADVSFKGVTSGGGVVFFQTSESLAPEDTDEAPDVYARDLEAEPPTTTLVSQAAASCASGGCGNGPEAAIFVGASTDGERVFFETAESFVPADADSTSDIYMRDLEAEPPTTTLVTTAGACPEGASASECRPKFRGADAAGTRVFFTTSEKLSGEDTDGKASDVYVWEEGTISLVSTGPTAANEADKPATFAGSRAGGAMVFFETGESLTGTDADGGASDVYVRDLEAEPSTTTLVSRGDPSCVEAGSCGAGGESEAFAGASASGEIVFVQTKERLSPEDTDSSNDVYARNLTAGTTTLASAADPSCAAEACGPPAPAVFAGASASGSVAFFTTEESLVSSDPESEDVYMRDLGGAAPTLESPAGVCPLPGEAGCDATFSGASEEGTHVLFRTARRLTAEDVDSDEDVYEREGARTRLVSASNSVALGPGTPVLTSLSPGTKGETLTPAVHGHAPAGTSIKVYTTPDCSGGAVAGTVEALEGAGIQVTVEAGKTTAIAATATDAEGVTSDCSNVLDYTQASAPPPSEGGGGGGGTEGGGGEGGGSTGGDGSTGGSGGSSSTGGSGGGIELGGIVYVAPVTRITFGPAFKTRARRVVFRFIDATEQPGSTFVCKLDRQRWRGCGSPFRTHRLKPGRHVFEVKGRSAAEQWEQRPVARRFKVVQR